MDQNLLHLKHLHLRAGFGPTPALWQQFPAMSIRQAVQQVFRDAEQAEPLAAPSDSEAQLADLQSMSAEERQMLVQKNREGLRDLNAAWLRQMAFGKAQLREKMTFFWHDHFATRVTSNRLMLMQNNTLRRLSLDTFGKLLYAVAQDPAMLQFLNNQQNRKEHPNENFARELLELFTLGRGHYTEKDIQEAARAFTGWGFDRLSGEFVFRRQQHDTGSKTFLGRTGNFTGNEILDILLEEKQTARYLTEKIYRFFVHHKLNEEVVNDWSTQFYESGYDIAGLLALIFSSDHFYAPQNIGTRIKSPVEYLAGLMRMLEADFIEENGPFFLQKALGQVLLMPPSVAGWPEGRSWIDSSSLMARLRIPQAMITSAELDLQVKEEFAGNEDVIGTKGNISRQIQTKINWEPLMRQLADKSDAQIKTGLRDYLLQSPTGPDPAALEGFLKGSTREEQIKSFTMRLLCTPEFQLC